jgi:hypothetical protein
MIVAFDVDDCLIIPACALDLNRDVPNYDTIAVYRWFQAQGHIMLIWSGGGFDYAQMWADKLGLKPDFVMAKEPKKEMVDIAFDDCDVDLAKVNVKVKRIHNEIKRKNAPAV